MPDPSTSAMSPGEKKRSRGEEKAIPRPCVVEKGDWHRSSILRAVLGANEPHRLLAMHTAFPFHAPSL